MFKEARAATDFNQIASLRVLGLAEQSGREQKIKSAAEISSAADWPKRFQLQLLPRRILHRRIQPSPLSPKILPRKGASDKIPGSFPLHKGPSHKV